MVNSYLLDKQNYKGKFCNIPSKIHSIASNKLLVFTLTYNVYYQRVLKIRLSCNGI